MCILGNMDWENCPTIGGPTTSYYKWFNILKQSSTTICLSGDPRIFFTIIYKVAGGAQDGGMWNGRVRVGSAEKENLEKLKLESSLGEVTER